MNKARQNSDDKGKTGLGRLAAGVREGERRALAKAITLVESTRADQRDQAETLLQELLPSTGGAVRLGLSGAPGVGKSTFVEAFGMFLIGLGLKVAVLAVDPSSRRSGGSILGDKTRMERLAREPNAFIRPSPAGATLGGVARRSREALLVVEAAGFDVVIVETVGVGQSETEVAEMVDLFALLLAPGGGDDLQGIKRGVMELADLVIVNKADGALLPEARRAASDYKAALGLMRPKYKSWSTPVLLASALEEAGIDEIWDAVTRFRTALDRSGELAALRRRQAVAWLWHEIRQGLVGALKSRPDAVAAIAEQEKAVLAGRRTPVAAAAKVLSQFGLTMPDEDG